LVAKGLNLAAADVRFLFEALIAHCRSGRNELLVARSVRAFRHRFLSSDLLYQCCDLSTVSGIIDATFTEYRVEASAFERRAQADRPWQRRGVEECPMLRACGPLAWAPNYVSR